MHTFDLTFTVRPTDLLRTMLNRPLMDVPATALHGALKSLNVRSALDDLDVYSTGHRIGVSYRTMLRMIEWQTMDDHPQGGLPPLAVRPRGHGRYDARIPTAPRARLDPDLERFLRARTSPVVYRTEANPWGMVTAWFKALAQEPFEVLKKRLPDLADAFALPLTAGDAPTSPVVPVATPTSTPEGARPAAGVAAVTSTVNVVRHGPIPSPRLIERPRPPLPASWAIWADRMAQCLGKTPGQDWCQPSTLPMVRVADVALNLENRAVVDDLARAVHTTWVNGCGVPWNELADTVFARARMASTAARRACPPRRPSIVNAPLFRHLAHNPAWSTHPEEGLALANALRDLGAPVVLAGADAALPEAVAGNRRVLVDWLLDHGAPINAPGVNGNPPAHEAMDQGHLDLARRLLRRGATVTWPSGSPAQKEARNQMLEHLLRMVIDPTLSPNVLFTATRPPMNSTTPLQFAVVQAHEALIHWLMDRGANPDMPNGSGESAWDLAAACHRPSTTIPGPNGVRFGTSTPHQGWALLQEAFVERERRCLIAELDGDAPCPVLPFNPEPPVDHAPSAPLDAAPPRPSRSRARL